MSKKKVTYTLRDIEYNCKRKVPASFLLPQHYGIRKPLVDFVKQSIIEI